jgi:hypothetical protein
MGKEIVRSAKKLLHNTLDQLSEQEAQETLRLLETIATSEQTVSLGPQDVSNAKKIVRLVASEATGRPDDLKPARFEPFHAIPVEGIPASQLLIADRR